MIVKDLYNLYERYVADSEMRECTPPEGMGSEKVFWEIVLSEKGELKNIRSLSWGDGKNGDDYRVMLVPRPLNERRSSNVKPYFLCDTAEYLLGLGGKKSIKKRDESRRLHEAVLENCDASAAHAMLKFFSQDFTMGEWNTDRLEDVLSYKKANNRSNLLVFRFQDSGGKESFVHELPLIIDAWNDYRARHPESEVHGQCFVTGREATLVRVFLPVTGFPGAQSSGASLISFNCGSFNSYGKTQAYNASISERVAFGAGTALKILLADSKRRVPLGDTVFTFWSDRSAPDEDDLFWAILKDERPSEDAGNVKRVQRALDSIKKGRPLGGDFDVSVRYYVLGISPNAARLSVRFFETATLGEVATHFTQYLKDIEMVDVQILSLFQLIRQCAVRGEPKNIPSTLVNPCVQAMLTGNRFPRSLLSTLLSRMRADHGSYEVKGTTYKVTDQRVSLIKACLVRGKRFQEVPITRESEIDVALNRENNRTGYLLGRLFAVMERAQSAALGTTNATIRDKYIGSASVTPARVMPTLMHGCQNHLSDLRKKKPGLNDFLEKELDEIVGKKLSDNPYPGTLSMEEQGEFFIGYYQERVYLWTSHKQDGNTSDEMASNDPSEN